LAHEEKPFYPLWIFELIIIPLVKAKKNRPKEGDRNLLIIDGWWRRSGITGPRESFTLF
jgi:hypothetical protein